MKHHSPAFRAKNTRRRSFRSFTWLLLALYVFAHSNSLGANPSTAATPAVAAVPQQALPTPAAGSTRIYLPLIATQDTFGQQTAIWADGTPTGWHEVVLFRGTFTLAETASAAQLLLFADTRYEAWLDGNWIGRGPARFSRETHEYDTYDIGALAPGRHVIAVLVQWSPNYRRSESQTPMLQALLRGQTSRGQATLLATDPEWRALRSDAWRRDAALVHSWGLIGATELLDLRRLPANWTAPGFSDDGWPAARAVPLPGAVYLPRSIPQLANVPISAVIRGAGVLAPGRQVIELPAPAPQSYTLPFTAQTATLLTIDALVSNGLQPADVARLDGKALTWLDNPTWHPDLRRATASVTAGTHRLSLSGIPPDGWSFALSTNNIIVSPPALQQGANAGRRLLLAEPAVDTTAVSLGSQTGLDLTFHRPQSYAVLDLGRVVHGRLVADVTGPAGAVVDIGWDERLWHGSRPLPYPGSLHPQWNQTDSWVLDGQARQISTIDARAGRYVLIAVWGGGPVRLGNVRVFEERLPLQLSSSFSSSDARLNQIWKVGVDTLYPNMNDAYADPWRERGQWWGDAYVDEHISRVAFGTTSLLPRGLRLMAEAVGADGRPLALAPNGEGNYLLDYGMLWVQSIHDYAIAGGDTQLIAQLYPIVVRMLSYLQRHENASTGLLDLAPGPWSETSYIDTLSSGVDRYGQPTALNALYYGTLRDAADISEQLGDTRQAAAWRQRAARVRDQINRTLYLPGQQRYISGIIQGVKQPPTPYAQAWALAYDVVPPDRRDAVASALIQQLGTDPDSPHVGVYGMFWVLEGLARAGRLADALAIIKIYYGHMLDLGATTWWEHFTANKYYSSSLSHGWGGGPTWFLTSHVLGARRTGPANWVVEPAIGLLPTAAGALPFDRGPLGVSWATLDCTQQSISIDAPPGSSGSVLVPLHDPQLKILLEDVVAWQNGQPQIAGVVGEAGGVRIALTSGSHHLSVQHPCGAT